jgi:hypothetical protein
MKCQRNASPNASCLAGFREDAELLDRDVLRRDDDRHRVADLGTDLLVARADVLRRHTR